jgi:GAF domain-containing protein
MGDEPERKGSAVGGPRGRAVFTGVGTLCETAVRMTGVDGAAAALLTSRSRLRDLVYATDPVAQRIDELQFTLGEGPCLDAYSQARAHLIDDLRQPGPSERWPGFVEAARGVGVEAVFALPISDAGQPLGVLELYRATAGPLSQSELDAGLACAARAGETVAASWAEYVTRARNPTMAADALALDLTDPDTEAGFSRTHVFTASGMLAVQMGISPEEALDRLRAYAFRTDRPIGDVAFDVIGRRLKHHDLDDGRQ